MQALIEAKNGWTRFDADGASLCFRGWLEDPRTDALFQGRAACEWLAPQLETALSLPENALARLAELTHGLIGEFAYVYAGTAGLAAAVDVVRSMPLFYAGSGQGFAISNDPERLIQRLNPNERSINPLGRLEILTSGYITGPETFLKGLFQIQPGELLFFPVDSQQPQLRTYRVFQPTELYTEDENRLLDMLRSRTEAAFRSVVRGLEGRRIWTPLSGGYDSRLNLAMLRDLGHREIATYTYGHPRVWDVARAKEVAEYFGLTWRLIPRNRKRFLNVYKAPETERFFRGTSLWCSLSALNDYYSLHCLREDGELRPDDAVVNGQSGDFTTGNHIPAFALQNRDVPLAEFCKALLDKHFSLWYDRKTPENTATLTAKILKLLGLEERDALSDQEAALAWELWEWRERQSKYVVHQQQTYDWFGLEWRLPHWDVRLTDFWANVPWKTKAGQALYIKYLQAEDPGGAFQREWKVQPFTYVPLLTRPFSMLSQALARISSWDHARFHRKYLLFYQAHGFWYPAAGLREHIRRSADARSPLSFYAERLARILEAELSRI